jgi:thiol-disulfide isomerase/thioredoxin
MNDTMASPPASPARRQWLVAAVGAAALAAGAGAAWWRHRAGAADAGAAQRLWSLTLPTPQGGSLALGSLRGRPLLVNFWATWCPPCVEEMPLLDAFYRQHAANGWQTVGLAIDRPDAVAAFLRRTPVAFPVAIAGLEGTELTRSLGNGVGALPFSVLMSADGSIGQRRIGRVTPADLKAWSGLG